MGATETTARPGFVETSPLQTVEIPKYGIFENIDSLRELAQMPQWTPEKTPRVATGFTYTIELLDNMAGGSWRNHIIAGAHRRFVLPQSLLSGGTTVDGESTDASPWPIRFEGQITRSETATMMV
ncbi:hypothetical protein RHMOL_Rhmol11G0252400 [Rhododendron molle]|uniref:Uncharacterized protein n=1 Tax=Rhododendron molle TaxID=49168 RepID=A0ACC0LXX1_RHOML|nr:hypothetical protein RHMOL_Rhmol11G0252400 [Rhododendron molle]